MWRCSVNFKIKTKNVDLNIVTKKLVVGGEWLVR